MKISINRLFEAALSLPKTVYFNIKTFGIKGLRLPIYISYQTHIGNTFYDAISIEGKISTFMILFGVGGSAGVVPNSRSEIKLEKGSKLVFKGGAQFAQGCGLRNAGKIVLGNNFGMNRNSFLSCYQSVQIGDDFTAGWNVAIRDSDGHSVLRQGVKNDLSSPVIIGNKVWACSFAHILKGVHIGNNCIIAYRSLVTKKFSGDHLLIGGFPAKIIETDVDWEY